MTIEASDAFATRAGLDGFRATIAELHVHRAFAAVDPTATHIGGNRAIRDHELLDNTVWVNTKTAFPTSDPAHFGFSAVNWARARNPAKRDQQLDLIALVQLYERDITFRDAEPCSIEIRWAQPRWWLIPASTLHQGSWPDGKSTVRSKLPVSLMAPFEITARRPLTLRRLRSLIKQNVIAVPEDGEDGKVGHT